MNREKITIIVYKTSDELATELKKSLERVIIPEGYDLEVNFAIAPSRWQAYEMAMTKVDSKYKIYLNENTEIREINILEKMLKIFKSDKKIAVIGCSGAEVLSTNGICHISTKRCGKVFVGSNCELVEWNNADDGSYKTVEAVDGYFMATQYDLDWRHDLFINDSFGDTAQCIEFKRKGYISVVANQKRPWIWYKDSQLQYHEDNHQIFLKEYSADVFPMVSVILPTFNRPNYLPIALDSALNQTYRNIDIVVSDDSTNEESRTIMESKYVGKDHRIHYYRHPGFTGADNIKFLIDNINPKAEYINWLFDDDLIYPRKIELMVEAYRNNPDVSLVSSPKDMIDENGRFLRKNPNFLNQTKKFSGEEMGKLLFMAGDYIGTPVTALFKKEYFDGCWKDRKFKIKASGDVYAWLYLLSKGNLFWFSEALSAHREHPGEATYKWPAITGMPIDWAKYIKYYWDKKIFLKNENDIRGAIVSWFGADLPRVLAAIHRKNHHDDNVPIIAKLIVAMGQALQNDYVINWPEEDIF